MNLLQDHTTPLEFDFQGLNLHPSEKPSLYVPHECEFSWKNAYLKQNPAVCGRIIDFIKRTFYHFSITSGYRNPLFQGYNFLIPLRNLDWGSSNPMILAIYIFMHSICRFNWSNAIVNCELRASNAILIVFECLRYH